MYQYADNLGNLSSWEMYEFTWSQHCCSGATAHSFQFCYGCFWDRL